VPIDIPCPQCGKAPPCACPPLPPGPADPPPPKYRPEIIKMRREKRPGTREIVILEGFPRGGYDLEALAKDLKRRCGSGGTVRGFTIEIQGDHREALEAILLERGFRSKRAGG
jgi:translation initiation factor 1